MTTTRPRTAFWLLLLLCSSCASAQKADGDSPESYSATEGEAREVPAPAPKSVPVPAPVPTPAPKATPKPARPTPAPSPKATPKHSNLPPLLEELEAKYSHAATLSAEFTQVNEMAAMKQKKTSQGVLQAKRPGKMRWETQEPDPNLLVSDGQTFWFYTPPFEKGEHGQVIERRSSEVQSKLAHALLSGSFSMASDMKIEQKSPSEFVLLPKAGTAGTVERAEITVNLDKKLIEKVTLEHKGGNRSEISLRSIELGKTLGDDLFRFVPPPNTDHVDP